MDQLQLQDEDEANNTTWRITTLDPAMSHKLRGKKSRKSKKSFDGEDESVTVSTVISTNSQSKYLKAFQQGGGVASDLRAEEFVKRHFHNPDCELYHALTLEQYIYLSEYWKSTKIKDDQYCYEVWTIEEDDPSSWASLSDLPANLLSETIGKNMLFGGKVPETGAYPPDSDGLPQSVPPFICVENGITGKSHSIEVEKDASLMLEDGLYNHPEIVEAGVKEFPAEWQEKLDNDEVEIHCDVWKAGSDEAYHSFSLEDLKMASTKQLFELIPSSFEPIKLIIRCQEVVEVDDDWEDI